MKHTGIPSDVVIMRGRDSMVNDTNRICRKCGCDLKITTTKSGRQYERGTVCGFTYPVISLISAGSI